MSRQTKSAGAALIACYIVLRMGADPYFWRNVSVVYAYCFEVTFVIAGWFAFRRQIRLWSLPKCADAAIGASAAAAGFLVYLTAGWLHTPVPFVLNLPEIMFLLLVLAPVLEEAIFRMALWESIASLAKNRWVVLAATTFLFSAGHFGAYWFVPERFQGFVLYQTVYVTLLGLGTGLARLRTGAVSSAILVHFAFNLGFILGSKV